MILPPLPPAFEWRDTSNGPALVCLPLEAVASHLFTTAGWSLGRSYDGRPAAWDEVAAAFGRPAPPLSRLRQVHGCAVVPASGEAAAPGREGSLPEGDIVVASPAVDRVIAVQAADCVPMLFADTRTGAVAAAHAGWRGLALGVPAVTVRALMDRFASDPADLIVAVGPSIGACCYEVGPDVHAAFLANGFGADLAERWFLKAPAPTAGHVSLVGEEGSDAGERRYFDGWASVEEQLASAGVGRERMFVARLCTGGHAGVLCSYRRDRARAGRMAAAIRTPAARTGSQGLRGEAAG